MKCISCSKETVEAIRLPCVKCGKELIRCNKCRSLSIEYKCSNCEYRGP